MSSEKRRLLKKAIDNIVTEGLKHKCIEYGIYLNGGEDRVIFEPSINVHCKITKELYESIVYIERSQIYKSLNVNPNRVKKIYYHKIAGCMVVGILTDKIAVSDMDIVHII